MAAFNIICKLVTYEEHHLKIYNIKRHIILTCLNFHAREASGQVHSFNYKSEVTNNNPNHLANLNYAICIRMESGFCGIRYSPVDNFAFTLTGDSSSITGR